MLSRPVIAVTPGEPAGIGPDLVAALGPCPDADIVVIADSGLMAGRARRLKLPYAPRPWTGARQESAAIYELAVPVTVPPVVGRLDPRNSAYVIDCLHRAVHGCLGGEFQALVTGPVQKSVINDAGIPFTGHTEFLAKESGTPDVVMMLAAPDLRVALATTHLPIRAVPAAISRTHLTRVIEIVDADLRSKFGITRPVIAVCGLNPHAGEDGHIGREEIETIVPVLVQLRARGFDLRGPVPADTAFLPSNLVGVDAVLAMYHDQGLPVIKRHDFARTVNVTLGLPFIRTSVDHGTALDLAGTGTADRTSLDGAMDLAIWLAIRHHQ